MASNFKILNLLLTESSFKRETIVHFEEQPIERKIEVDVSVSIDGNNVLVQVTLEYEQVFEGVTEVECMIRYLGMFEYTGFGPMELENFGRTNGAAMIFPYIREYFTTLTTKSGMGLIFIPPFAFLSDKKEDEEKSK